MGCARWALILVGILVAGFVVPRILIPDGTNEFEGLKQYGAEFYLAGVKTNPLNYSDPAPEEVAISLITTAYRVEDIELCDGPPASEPDEPPPVYENPMTPEEEEQFIREEQPPEFRDYPIEVFRGNWRYEIQRYTVFGIPFVEESITCDERR